MAIYLSSQFSPISYLKSAALSLGEWAIPWYERSATEETEISDDVIERLKELQEDSVREHNENERDDWANRMTSGRYSSSDEADESTEDE